MLQFCLSDGGHSGTELGHINEAVPILVCHGPGNMEQDHTCTITCIEHYLDERKK